MRHLVVALLCSMGLVAGAVHAATPEAELMKPIHQFIDSFNKGDAATAEATHLASASITDEVAPYHWEAPGAFKAWAAALDAHDKKAGMSEQAVTLGKPHLVDSTADTAYVSLEAVYSFKQNGAAMREPARMTYALRKTAEGWKIASWTWSGAKAEKAK